MEKFVVSRELAEKLKAAGYPQNSLYFWERYRDVDDDWKVHLATGKAWETSEYNAAPLSDELLEQLPEYGLVSIVNSEVDLTLDENGKPNKKWVLDYRLEREDYPSVVATKPADALAHLWLELVHKGTIHAQ